MSVRRLEKWRGRLAMLLRCLPSNAGGPNHGVSSSRARSKCLVFARDDEVKCLERFRQAPTRQSNARKSAERFSRTSLPTRVFAPRVIAAATLCVIVTSARAEFPEVCSREGYALLDKCPATCAPACRDGAFNSGEATAACDRLLFAVAEGKGDEPECSGRAAPVFDSVLKDEISGLLTLAEIRAKCTKEYPGAPEGHIPDRETPPACVVSLGNLGCRFRALTESTTPFLRLTEQFSASRLGELSGLSLCPAKGSGTDAAAQVSSEATSGVTRDQLEHFYALSQAINGPFTELSAGFETESACVEELRTWNSKRQETCDATVAPCDQRIKSLIAAVDDRVKDDFATLGEISDALRVSKATVLQIEELWNDYKLICY